MTATTSERLAKPLSDKKIVSLLEATPDQVREGESNESAWAKAIGGNAYSEGFIAEQVRLGRWRATTVEVDGIASYVLHWGISNQGWLLLYAMTGLSRKSFLPYMQQGLEKLARINGCSTIQVQTASAAVFRVARNQGYHVLGVTLLKSL